jgi:hypothetical protein
MKNEKQKEIEVRISAKQLIDHKRYDVFEKGVFHLKKNNPNFNSDDYDVIIRKKEIK